MATMATIATIATTTMTINAYGIRHYGIIDHGIKIVLDFRHHVDDIDINAAVVAARQKTPH